MGSITRRAASYDALQYIRCDAAAVKRGTVIGFIPVMRVFACAKYDNGSILQRSIRPQKKGRTSNRYGPKSREETPKTGLQQRRRQAPVTGMNIRCAAQTVKAPSGRMDKKTRRGPGIPRSYAGAACSACRLSICADAARTSSGLLRVRRRRKKKGRASKLTRP